MELIVASSSVDTGIGCWDLVSGAEQLRYRSCASPPHGLVSVSKRFLASSQLRESPSSSSAPIFFWSSEKPQVQVRSFPAEPIGPLISDSDGSYIIGGGTSGAIFIWEVASGKLLNKLIAHYRSVTCLTLSEDESLLISGSEDGNVRVWPLLMIFDDAMKESGHGLCNSIVISSSEDRTCKVWSLSLGRLLRSITFPSIIDAVAMDPGEHIFYAGCRDGKIYIATLNAEWNHTGNYGKFIIDSLSDNGKAITCLAFSMDGVTLVSGSEDGIIRVWNTRNGQMTRFLKHAKAPISNILIIRQPTKISQVSLSRKQEKLLMAQPLDKYIDSREDEVESKVVKIFQHNSNDSDKNCYCAAHVLSSQLKELQQNASSGAAQMELERLRGQCQRSVQMAQQWKNLYKALQTTVVKELLSGVNAGSS
ncbi:protein ROOT INITIATION DEFECTIVE 3 isoform X2 [Phalaenopsis equestris]|uniref:protein ROOT INITIATION DEFECTIVE 3 isoform X2 n=1 Tax=Phalaenopsis equestris TaxID=78828 RepID=UPI0009E414EB|nr:protein ROOT INITIATION DEFECTIVE 3 isoform X2 [Phalaenopsis equestris]